MEGGKERATENVCLATLKTLADLAIMHSNYCQNNQAEHMQSTDLHTETTGWLYTIRR